MNLKLGTLYCSFCGKSQDEVMCLMAGPTVFICDGCTEIAMKIVEDLRRLPDFEKALPNEPRPTTDGKGE